MSTLVITNSDIAVNLLKSAEIEADVIAWHDLLYSGPCVNSVNEPEFFKNRTQYIADYFQTDLNEVTKDIESRNQYLDNHGQYDRIELWFEHDLNDQLQLLQILQMLAKRSRLQNIHIVQALSYLNLHNSESILSLKNLTIPVDNAMIERALILWSAFTSDTPEKLNEESKNPTPGYPVMKLAIKRVLQELPGRDGLSLTERYILYSVNRNVPRPGMLLARVNNMEEAAFHVDTTFFNSLSQMTFCEKPLISGLSEAFDVSVLEDGDRRKAFITSQVELTELGSRVLDGLEDHTNHNSIDRWLGGIHLTNDALWKWEPEQELLISPS